MARVGLIVPSSNTVMEADLYRRLPADATLLTARMYLVETTPAGEAAMLDDHLPGAVRDLATARPDAVVFGCTSAGALRGNAYEAELVRRIAGGPLPIAPSNGYGLTETTSAIASNTGADYVAAPDAVGRPVPSADVRVVDPETGADLPDGEVGELWFRGPNVVRGYRNAPQATAAAFVDGWFRTGDLGWVGDGIVRVVDRLKDVVLRGGENVYGAEVEGVLLEHPDVLDAAVVGVPHPSLGEEVGAVVVVRPGAALDAEAVHRHVAGRLAAFKAPTVVRVGTEPLPRNAVGKVLKAALRERM
jgi:acyl-CoA synthetase (AMP-forming)/AMP-acid ligase II